MIEIRGVLICDFLIVNCWCLENILYFIIVDFIKELFGRMFDNVIGYLIFGCGCCCFKGVV